MYVQINTPTPVIWGGKMIRDSRRHHLDRNPRTYICQMGCVPEGNMTEILCNLLDLGSRLWVLRVGVQDCIITIDKILNKTRKYKTDERLRSYATIDKSDTREEKKV